jgi:5-formyltetrahydrofolate cyclo-ligase
MTGSSHEMSVADSAQQRRGLRQHLLVQREAMPTAAQAAASGQIAVHLQTWLDRQVPNARTVALYSPHRGEPDLWPWARSRDLAFALPVVAGKGQPLQFAAWQPGDATTRDAYGILIPAHVTAVQPDALIIPCLGFTQSRLRLGYGGGYYDRTLRALHPRPAAVGVAFAWQQCSFQAAAHDVALDAIITENGVI